MKKRTLIRGLLSIVLVIYLGIMLALSNSAANEAMCTGVIINVADAENRGFVTAEDIDHELGGVRAKASSMTLEEANTDQWEQILNSIDDIEECNCVKMTDGTIHVNVVPMRPIARVFNSDGSSLYFNKNGKTMKSSLRYRIDVPIIINHKTGFKPMTIVPTLNHICQDSLWNSVVSAVEITKNGDIILIPSITGHVINIGDTSNVENKLKRMSVMYRKVIPVKGWNYYDTISVKWDGQIVATRSKKPVKHKFVSSELIDDDIESVSAEELNNAATSQRTDSARI